MTSSLLRLQPPAAAAFPAIRPRRLRRTPALRQLVRETRLTPSDVIYPMFVRPGHDLHIPISSMPGQAQWSVDRLVGEVKAVAALGIPGVMLFGIPEHKDESAARTGIPHGVVPQRDPGDQGGVPEMVVISDMCFCEYTDHGHCGIINHPGHEHFNPPCENGYLLNDPTLELLARASIAHAEAGADMIAPSGMIDGMVGAIRAALDHSGFEHVAIMSYAAKFASGFYGPFREAAESPAAVRRPQPVPDGPRQPPRGAPAKRRWMWPKAPT